MRPPSSAISLGKGLLEEINAHLQGLRLREGTIVDASIIGRSSTKNRSGERDPEMHQTKKGNQWHFGMKAHIGVDADTAQPEQRPMFVTEAHGLLRWGDAGVVRRRIHREENFEWLRCVPLAEKRKAG